MFTHVSRQGVTTILCFAGGGAVVAVRGSSASFLFAFGAFSLVATMILL